MRTKKILSILLAAIMAIGAVGIVGVFAEEPQEAVTASVGESGWGGVIRPADFYENETDAGSPDSAVVVWSAFVGAGGKPSDTDSFISKYNADTAAHKNKATTFEWKAYKVQNNPDTSTLAPIDVKEGSEQASTTSGTYWEIYKHADYTDVKLIITQARDKWYNWVRVELTVTVDGVKSAPAITYVQLIDPGPLAKLLLKVEDEMAKTDRYTVEYLALLKKVFTDATKDVNKKISQAKLDGWVNTVNLALAGKDADGKALVKIYKFTGWEWLDGLFKDPTLKVFWSIRDFFGPFINVIGQLGRALGFLLNFIFGLGGLFS